MAELGVCYYPEHWPEQNWATDAAQMKQAGLNLVRIGEFSWSRLEPEEGKFSFAWLDRAIDTLGKAGLKIVLGTPTATPPRWVVKKYPDMLARDRQGQVRKFGSRRHYCFSHKPYRKEAARMAADMAKRYGKNEYIYAWQIDNEYGCHDTTLSFSPSARAGFCAWLKEKYGSVDALNQAWGNVFWSMEYGKFDEIDLPNLTVTEANPSHWLDFYRYSSDQVIAFNRAQIEAMRAHTDRPLIHNYMGRVTDFDHFTLGVDLDIAAWDSYPLGFLEAVLEDDENWKLRFARQGDSDFQAFHHDLYRAVGKKRRDKSRWWVLEQQPGPVNWGPYNPAPLKGMVKTWAMEAFAHGAEAVCFFRWRQALFAQEQMHAGLCGPNGSDGAAMDEVRQLAGELQSLGEIENEDVEVAIIFDYQSQWAWQTQKQGKNFDYFRLVFETYRGLRRLGFSVDFLKPDCADFGKRKLVLIPGLMAWNDALLGAIKKFDGVVVAGPRSGSKTQHLSIPPGSIPDMPGVDAQILQVESLRPGLTVRLEKGGRIVKWFEQIKAPAEQIIETTIDGAPVLVGENNRFYLGAWLDDKVMVRVLAAIAAKAGLAIMPMPEGVRRRQMGSKQFIVNYNSEAVRFEGQNLAPASYQIV